MPAANVVVNDVPDSATVVSEGVSPAQKIKGAAQMAGGAVLVAAGVPMCVLPGPGVAAIAGGAALASKGQRNYTGRAATPVEEKLDAAAAKFGTAAKEQAAQAARRAAEKAPEVAERAADAVARQAPKAADAVAKAAPKVADQVAQAAPVVADRVAKAAPAVAERAVQAARAGAGFAARGIAAVAKAGDAMREEARRKKNGAVGAQRPSSVVDDPREIEEGGLLARR